jgi:hypothetical protein
MTDVMGGGDPHGGWARRSRYKEIRHGYVIRLCFFFFFFQQREREERKWIAREGGGAHDAAAAPGPCVQDKVLAAHVPVKNRIQTQQLLTHGRKSQSARKVHAKQN